MSKLTTEELDVLQFGRVLHKRPAMTDQAEAQAALDAVRAQVPVTVGGLRRMAARKTEPHEADDKFMALEAAELIEHLDARLKALEGK